MKRDLLLTFLTQALVLVCGLLVYRTVNVRLGNEGFSVYALCRRTHSFLFPALAVGCSVAIPRYIAYRKTVDAEKADGYFKAGACILGCTVCFFFLLVGTFPEFVARILFGHGRYAYLGFPIGIMMAGFALHSIGYAYYRGHSRMIPCNVLQAINLAIVPVLVAYSANTPEAMLAWTGACWALVGCCALCLFIMPKLTGNLSLPHLKELIVYGIQRLPSDFGVAALFGLPATLTAHHYGVVAGGHVAFGLSLLSMCGGVLNPIGQVILPLASAASARKDSALVNRYLKLSLWGSAALSIPIFLLFECAAEPLLFGYLGRGIDPSLISTVQIVMIASVPYSIYVASRSVIDAFFVMSVGSINVMLSLLLFVLLISLAKIGPVHTVSPLNALVASMFILAIATLTTCRYIHRRHRAVE
jgi:O-antigen/teichoic acid export membrane protein